MPLTFGSFGDIVQLSILIKDLVKCIKKSRAAFAEYQATIRELGNLDRVLIAIKRVLHSHKQSLQLTALIATAFHCVDQLKNCIGEFYAYTTKFETTLGARGSVHFFKVNLAKFRWTFSEGEKLAKFRAEITAQGESLKMCLVVANINLLNLHDENTSTRIEAVHRDLRASSVAHASSLNSIGIQIDERNALIKASCSDRAGLAPNVDYFKRTLREIVTLVRNIWDDSRKIYHLVVSIHNQLPARLDKFWTQQPGILEDSLGRVTPIHLEFVQNREAFDAVLEVRYRQCPGHRMIQEGQYVLQAAKTNKDIEKSTDFKVTFLPGHRIVMVMVYDGSPDNLSTCPFCKFETAKIEENTYSQVQCPDCGKEYQRVTDLTVPEPRGRYPLPPEADSPNNQSSDSARSKKRQRPEDASDEEDPDHPANFRRVRLRHTVRDQDGKPDIEDDPDDSEITNQNHIPDIPDDPDDPEVAAETLEKEHRERKKARAETRELKKIKKERAERKERERKAKEQAERTPRKSTGGKAPRVPLVRKSTGGKAPRKTVGGKGPARKTTGGKAPRA